MIVIQNSDKSRVIHIWLKGELYRVKNNLTKEEIDLVENANFLEEGQNKGREDLLLSKYSRSAIFDKLPQDIVWFEIQIEEKDLDRMYLIPVWDWYLDSGKTFQLKQVSNNISPSRRMPISETHYGKIDQIIASGSDDLDGIIMISSSTNGPFTIIEGTHRSAALLKKNKLTGTRGCLGISRHVTNCFWSIERDDINQYMYNLKQSAEAGEIW